ncbi:MAG TPA: ATP-binding protein [Dehalococcoidia bacterium]|nr:ATP-binding protein [Dehalococcoidia bacterium]
MRLLKENLLLQFSVVSFIVLATFAVSLATILTNKIRSDAINNLAEEAIGASSGRLLNAITPADLELPMTGERYDRFHQFVRQNIASDRTARVKLWATDGTVIYSNDPAGVGEKFPTKEILLKSLRGETAVEIKMPTDAENAREMYLGTLMEVYTPVVFPGDTEIKGAFEIYQYYLPTAQRISSMQLWVFGSVGLGFLVLYASLVSIVWRGWRMTVGQRNRLSSLNTELEDRVQELGQRTTAVEATNAELEAFCYSVSHDLRTPLRSIDGFSQALLEDYGEKLDAPGKEYVARVRTASQRMGQLIDDLLGLSRMTRNKMQVEEVNLSEIARTVAAELKERQSQRQVESVIAPDLVVKGDGKLLRIALENLLGNAWKFTSKQSHPRIEFGVTQSEGKPAYFVRDNGAGFDMAYAGKLFGAFQRLHQANEFEGTGIGLATVQRIIHRHGGKVWAEGAVGQGATFYFTL